MMLHTEVLHPKNRNFYTRFLIPTFFCLALVVLLLNSSLPLKWRIPLVVLAELSAVLTGYLFFGFRTLMRTDGKYIAINSYLKRKTYYNNEIKSLSVKRGASLLHLLDVKMVIIVTSSGKEEFLFFPDFCVKEFEKMLLTAIHPGEGVQQ
jgi:hypothetical protein